ncbi:MAG: division plane positioning ATPase MipZ [Alphaproteobacteria bacterium]|jgi:chromosome partitioning protein|nr:division plane positioning ATPase MipZ [Alphaproteobacteria bacterium]
MSAIKKPYVIVLGNEKGGTGKSTLSMHLITYLTRLGCKVGSIDVDAHQGSLTRYLENRFQTIQTQKFNFPMPDHHPILRSQESVREAAEADEKQRLLDCMAALTDKDFVVIDTPGSDSSLSRIAHAQADTLITPLNDSFVDLDVLARVCSQTGAILRPSSYAEMVWEQKKIQAMQGRNGFDWVVVRNRLSSINARNKEDMLSTLEKLAQRVRFRTAPGFGERVIFRELFLSGMTLLDLPDAGVPLTLSHVAARQELIELLKVLKLPRLNEQLETQEAA